MQNLDFLICPVLYLASACFLASEALPRCLAKSSPRPGQVSHCHQRHLSQCPGPCRHQEESIFPGFIVSSPTNPQTLWSRAVALLSISSMEQICAFLPSVWEEDAEPHCRAGGSWPCPWSPGWEPVGPGFAWAGLGILLLLTWGEDLLPASAAVPQCLLSYRGQAGSRALHSCPHGQGCGTSTGSTHLGASSNWYPAARAAPALLPTCL